MEESGIHSEQIAAVVRGVDRIGSYATACPEEGQPLATITITFSFQAWTGKKMPMKGQCVILSQVSKFEKGWRALHVDPVTHLTRA